MDTDARGFKVALVQSELVNPPAGGLDALAVLEQAGWGAIQLPASDYPDEVADRLLEQAAEQAEEFVRNGYRLAVVGRRRGLDTALARYGLAEPQAIEPESAEELRDFLEQAAY